uniref:hypothetical protein n=1 Tax=Nocardia sp. NRRL WC-3656 TaxID=1463824 RepID=UPI00055FCE5B
MTAEGWGLVAAVGIPIAVIVLAVVWPERVAKDIARDNSVQGMVKSNCVVYRGDCRVILVGQAVSAGVSSCSLG